MTAGRHVQTTTTSQTSSPRPVGSPSPVAPRPNAARPAPPVTDETGAVVPAAGPARWTALFGVEHAPDGEPVASGDGEVLICNRGGALHALRNRCGGTPLPLHFGQLVEGRLQCPWHKECEYDMDSGESSSGRRTVVYPVRVDRGRVSVALNHGRSTGPLQPTRLRAEPM